MRRKKNKTNSTTKTTNYKRCFLILTITIVVLLIFPIITKEKKTIISNQNQQKDQMISNILSYQLENKINKEFLNWIETTYDIDVLRKLNEQLQKGNYQNQIWHELTNNSLNVLLDQYNQVDIPNSKQIETTSFETTLSFVGDVSLADNWYIMPKYDERNKRIYGILSEEVVNIMTKSDVMVVNNEFTISNRGTKIPNKLYTFRASPSRLNIYKEMGVDLVTLANNHVYDFGEDAFNDTLDSLKEYNIPYIGAGRNIEEAKKPYYFIVNGYKIGFVNATRAEKYILTPEATETTSGVLRCYEPTILKEVIQETKKQSDYVIALVHWGKEDSSELEPSQLETSKMYIDAGADVIVGSHAHTLQGIDFYHDKAIIYNLGDFIFNNETKDTGILQIKITQDGELKYYFLPCKEKEEYTYLLETQEKERVLNKIRALSPNITIKEDGEFIPK